MRQLWLLLLLRACAALQFLTADDVNGVEAEADFALGVGELFGFCFVHFFSRS
jgi:hypothetical protein